MSEYPAWQRRIVAELRRQMRVQMVRAKWLIGEVSEENIKYEEWRL